eukprot:TRINITY_DN8010_c0_g1_i4.p1 TRINITY_DN8010_c0_g1~~TRINITY_DN8010_c0_g1_i4.p1  ORF type:complete len:759 (+),score=91.92 TRINITY_DN8010_c0_g1_i4:121-2397(+)
MGYSFIQNFVFAIGIIVANVPQGLPATVTLTLTITARKLAYENVLVKNLLAIETLGSVSLIASDKTGTLTMNKMKVVNVWTSMEHIPAESFNMNIPGAQEIIEICFMCSRSRFEESLENNQLPLSERRVIGDATETGLLKFGAQFVSSVPEFPMVFSIPFNSENKWHMSIHRKPHNRGIYTLYFKGAPERVFDKCSHFFLRGQIEEIQSEHKIAFEKTYEKFARNGQRVLAFAMCELPGNAYGPNHQFMKEPPTFPQSGFVFMGMVGIIDPPKPGVREAVSACQKAGIQVMMVTGDHPLTAEAIARDVGIVRGKTQQGVSQEDSTIGPIVEEGSFESIVVHGDHIDNLTDRQWNDILRFKNIVFARTSPKHKLEIVLRCQAVGHIVAMTGDGVNDSPALKRADLGISMGISGSDISKEAAAMILLDDNFPSIIQGVKQGRVVFECLKKSICYVLAHLVPEMVPFILYIAIGIPLGISPLIILLIDLGTEILPGIMFAYEPGESDIMDLPPRKIGQVYIPQGGEDVVRSLCSRDATQKPELSEDTQGRGFLHLWETICQFFSKSISNNPSNNRGRFETLVDSNLLIWSYLHVGAIETVACFFQYFAIYWSYGIYPSDLVGTNQDHFTGDDLDEDFVLGDTIFSGEEQTKISREAQASYFLCLVMMQLMNMYISKSRRVTFKPYMLWNNRWTMYATIYAPGIALFLIYVPKVQDVFSTSSINGYPYLWSLPFMTFLFIYDFSRKYLLQRLGPDYGRYLYW